MSLATKNLTASAVRVRQTGQHCFELDECPFRAALEIYADIERGIFKVER